MSDLGNIGGAVGGTIALLIALKPYLLPQRSSEPKTNGIKAGNIDPTIWRVWIREDCQEAVKNELGRVVCEIHDKQDASLKILAEHGAGVHEFNERQLAIVRDIRAAQQSIENKLTALLDRRR